MSDEVFKTVLIIELSIHLEQTLSKEEAEFCDSETSRLLPRLSKIVESDEEELQDKIEEVVIVHPVEDDDDASEEDAYVHSFMVII